MLANNCNNCYIAKTSNNSKVLSALPFNWIFLETQRNSRKHDANTIALVRTFHIFVLVLAKLTLTQYFRWSLENNIFWNSCMWKTEGAHFVVARIWYISRLIQVRDRMNINQSTMPRNTYLIMSQMYWFEAFVNIWFMKADFHCGPISSPLN